VLVLKIRQTYQCKEDVVCIQFIYNKQGLIAELKEIEPKSNMEVGEFILPRVEVTDDCFFKIINNPKLK
jgi:hypothetical protein